MPPISNLSGLEHPTVEISVRTRILQAAVSVLHSDGFSALTQTKVASRAGVRQSHVTYYFPTRVDLLRGVAQFGCAQFLDTIEGGGKQGTITLAQLREFLLPSELDRGWFRLMTGLMIACEEDPSIRTWLSEFDASLLSRIHVAFCSVVEGVSLESVQMLHACFIGALHLDMQVADVASIDRARNMVGLAIDCVVAQAQANSASKERLK